MRQERRKEGTGMREHPSDEGGVGPETEAVRSRLALRAPLKTREVPLSLPQSLWE
jgi:hypothetical protein